MIRQGVEFRDAFIELADDVWVRSSAVVAVVRTDGVTARVHLSDGQTTFSVSTPSAREIVRRVLGTMRQGS